MITNQQFKIGQTVVLTLNGTIKTVNKVGDQIECIWFENIDDKKPTTGRFNPKLLEIEDETFEKTKIEVANPVMLKSGGPKMMINSTDKIENYVECIWENGRDNFHQDVLVDYIEQDYSWWANM